MIIDNKDLIILVNELIFKAKFTDTDIEFATREQCGTFALALHDALNELSIPNSLILFAYDPEWEFEELTFKYPNELKWDYFNHVAVGMSNNFFDITGSHSALEMARKFGANGLIDIKRDELVKHMGLSDKCPLFFEQTFYHYVKDKIRNFDNNSTMK